MSKVQQAIKLLRHQDPNTRKKAITFLAKSGEQDALKALAWSYKNDPEPSLRELAKKGGVYLKRELDGAEGGEKVVGGASLLSHQKRVSSEPQKVDSAFAFDDEDDEDDNEDDYGYGDTTSSYDDNDDNFFEFDDDEEDYDYNDNDSDDGPIDYEARRTIDEALNLHIDGFNQDALEQLGKAYDIDRRTAKDSQAMNVIGAITGLDADEAMSALKSPVDRARLIESAIDEFGGDEKIKREGKIPTWGTTWTDIGILMLINVVGWVVGIILVANRFTPTLQAFSQSQIYFDFVAESGGVDVLEPLLATLQQAIGVLIAASIGISITTVISILIMAFILHFIATGMFSGKYPSVVTVDSITNLSSGYYVIFFVLTIGVMFALPTDYRLYFDESGSGSIAFFVYNYCLSPILSFGYLIGLGIVLGRAQKIGIFHGCLSIVVLYGIIFVLSCGCGFLFSILGSAGAAAVPTG